MGQGFGACNACSKPVEDDSFVERGPAIRSKPGLSDELEVEKVVAGAQERNSASPATGSTVAPETENADEDEPEEEGAIVPSLGEEALAVLEEDLAEVQKLVRQARVFDAAAALKRLEQDVLSRSPARRHQGGDPFKKYMDRLEKDPLVIKLREVEERLNKVLSLITPQALPGGAHDKRWVSVHIADDKIHADFNGEISIRFAEGAERDPHGSSTQIICSAYLSSYPLEIEKFISVYRETDLYQKEWVADCERCDGEVAGPEMLYSAKSRFINSSPILPVRLDIITVRDFASCSTSPVPDRGPGVLVMDMSPPHNAKTFHGWDIPDHYRKSVRVNGVEMFLYFTPSPNKPGFTDVFAFAKAGAPVPQWLVPLSLLKRFFANHFMTLFSLVKLHIADGWDALHYKERIAGTPDFYEFITALKKGQETSAAVQPSTAPDAQEQK